MIALAGEARRWEPKRLRLRLFSIAGRLVRGDRRLRLRLAERWPWADASGSYLALSHLASDVADDAMAETFQRLNARMAETVVLRTRDEVRGLFGGLEMIEPGVVQLPQWRPDPDAPPPGLLPMWCGARRKVPDRR